nr:immunoglobulin light chain junction region [Macaca mulatta]MOV66349.1 immunoglobulin light chain junction region [Macaca mulatta]MOV66748.1 immunoglobulin light chain junction region [Macaca mulatta]MOV67661.1 immunoglobulin light chain junction region [Macaca mulatta]MOV67732.1 immunoglobulin light chain junction region [Macaca mulatta]
DYYCSAWDSSLTGGLF